jgi:CHAT domain-containing protein/tetratricopeptide (TPR) repeat protein
MRCLLMALSAVLLIPVLAAGQELPKATKEGKEALQKLVDACVADGVLKTVAGPKGKQLTVADEGKLRATVSAHPELLVPALPETLLALWTAAGEDRKAVATSLLRVYGEQKKDERTLGWAAFCTGKAAEARLQPMGAVRHYEEALKHFRAAGELGWQAICLNNIGTDYDGSGDRATAVQYYVRALAVLRKLHRSPHPTVAMLLDNIGGVYADLGDPAKAVQYGQEALAMWRKLHHGPDSDLADGLNDAALIHDMLGDFTASLSLYQEALAMRRQLPPGPERDRAVASLLNDIGKAHLALGDYPKGLDCLRQSVAMSRAVDGGLGPDTATHLDSLGMAYHLVGDYARAVDYTQQALAIRKKVFRDPHPAIAVGLNDVGAAYAGLKQYGKALEYGQQALAIYRRLPSGHSRELARSLHNTAAYYAALGDQSKALEHYQQALDLWRKVYPGPHPDIAKSLNSIGLSYSSLRDYARARDYYQQALAMKRKLYKGAHPSTAVSLSSIAWTYFRERDYSRALQTIDEALQEVRLPSAGQPPPGEQARAAQFQPLPLTVSLLSDRGQFVEAALPEKSTPAQLRECERYYTLAADVLDRLRQGSLVYEASKLQAGAEQVSLTAGRLRACGRLYELEGKPGNLRAAFQAAEQGRARVFLDALGQARAGLLGGVSPPLRAKEEDLLRRLRNCDLRIERAESGPGRTDAALAAVWEERRKTEAELQALVGLMEKNFPLYAALQYPKPCSVEEARACLGPDEVALHFVLGDKESYALLLEGKPALGDRANGLALYVLPGRDVLTEQVIALVDPETLALPARVRNLGAELYAQLLAPLAARLRGKDLVIVPDGPLGYLPFELLVEKGDGGGRFLIENHRIRYAASLTALDLGRRWASRREHQPDRLLWALGDPVYGAGDQRLTGKPALAAASLDAEREVAWREGEGREPFRRLRFSGQEVERVRKLLGEPLGSVLLGQGATESAVRRASAKGDLARARYVHFACHGILGLHDGQPPALVLSLVGNSGTRDEYGVLDGFLRLDEVTHLRLNADLVVLSACRSGQGRLYNGEGVVGLARAFLHAGSRGVVCGLWSVDDKETADFMAAMYGHLRSNRPAADSLRDTQLEKIRAGKAPLYWAPFVLIGE